MRYGRNDRGVNLWYIKWTVATAPENFILGTLRYAGTQYYDGMKPLWTDCGQQAVEETKKNIVSDLVNTKTIYWPYGWFGL